MPRDESLDRTSEIDAICRRFNQQLQAGQSPRIEDVLNTRGNADYSQLLRKLLVMEAGFRSLRGEHPTVAEYSSRFPEQQAIVDEVFRSVLRSSSANVETVDVIPVSSEDTVVPDGPDITKTFIPGSTTEPESSTSADNNRTRFGDYELLHEIARGGMGVVYKARQAKLNRIVALKMIRSGELAGQDEVQRFHTEAEAAAQLDHPNIVPIFEVGEHNGLHFFSMGFVDGSGLDTQLKDGPLPPNDAAELIGKVAEAIQYAHDRGIVHRDLKPANVLIDADGKPRITDFGLAKNFASDSGMTATGQVMGTPSYMPPEQAAGKTDEIGPLADVYSLGAMLYALLTGRPPFQAANVMETLKQVCEQEPASPRQLNPGIDRDLENVCLKCLEKEPNKRYGTAKDLAEDLQRYLRKEPVLARPVGRIGKLKRRAGRNPVVASLIALAAVFLCTGTTVSTVFAVLADSRAEEADEMRSVADDEAGKAKASEARAIKREQEATAARKKLQESNKNLLVSVARSLGRPLLSEISPGKTAPPLRDAEREALQELMESPDDDLRVQFFKEAVQTPLKTRQLRLRAEEAILASVGLSSIRRERVERVLSDKLLEKGIDNDHRIDLAMIAIELGDLSPEVSIQVTRAFVSALQTADFTTDTALSQKFEVLAAGMDSVTASRAAEIILNTWAGLQDSKGNSQFASGLSVLLPRLKPGDAAKFGERITKAIIKEKDPATVGSFVRCLAALTPNLDSGDAQRIASTLCHGFMTSKESSIIRSRAEALNDLASRLENQSAAELCSAPARELADEISRSTDSQFVYIGADGLDKFIARLDPQNAANCSTKAVNALQKLVARPIGNRLPIPPAVKLASLASHMKPEEGVKACSQAAANLISVAAKLPQESQDLRYLTKIVVTLAVQMNSEDAGARLTEAMAATPHPFSIRGLAEAPGKLSEEFIRVVERLKPDDAGRIAATTIKSLTEKPNPRFGGGNEFQQISNVLTLLSARMNSTVAGRIGQQLTAVIGKTSNRRALQVAYQSLAAVTTAMSAEDRAKSVAVLIQALEKNVERDLAYGLSAAVKKVAGSLEPNVAAESATVLLRAMKTSAEQIHVYNLTAGFTSLTPQLNPDDAAKIAAEIRQALDKTSDRSAQYGLLKCWIAVVVSMKPDEATATLCQILKTRREASSLKEMISERFAAIANRSDQKQAEQVVQILVEAMSNSPYPESTLCMTEGLTLIAQQFDQQEASKLYHRATGVLVNKMKSIAANDPGDRRVEYRDSKTGKLLGTAIQSVDSHGLKSLSAAVAMLAARLDESTEAKFSNDASEILAAVMHQSTNQTTARNIVEGFAILAKEMEPEAADRVATKLAGSIERAMEKSMNDFEFGTFAESLASVATRMNRQKASQVCCRTAALLFKKMNSTTDTRLLYYLVGNLILIQQQIEEEDAAKNKKLLANFLVTKFSETLADVSPRRRLDSSKERTLQLISSSLGVLARKLPPQHAAKITGTLCEALTQATDPKVIRILTQALAALAARLEADAARDVSARLIEVISKTTDTESANSLQQCLAAVLAVTNGNDVMTRGFLLGHTAGQVAQPIPVPTSRFHFFAVARPFQPRLQPVDLAELLKLYTCTGPARRRVLDQLQVHYKKTFATQWDFVRCAMNQKLDQAMPIDLSSPCELSRRKTVLQ